MMRSMHYLMIGILLTGGLGLVGCTRPATGKPKPPADKASEQRRDQDVQKALAKVTPEVKGAFQAAAEPSLVLALQKINAVAPKTSEEQVALTAAQTKVVERTFAETPTSREEVFTEMAKSAPAEVKPIYNAGAKKDVNLSTVANAVKEALKYWKGPEADAALTKIADEMKDIGGKLKKATGKQRKALLNQLDAKSKEFDKRSKELAKEGQWERIGGAAVAAAEVMSDVDNLSKGWDDKSDAEKVAGIIGIVGNCCLMVAPFLPPPANAIVAAIGAALKLLEFIIPKLFGGGSGGDGQADGKDKSGGGKDASPDNDNSNKKKPADSGTGSPGGTPGKADSRGVTNAAIEGALNDANGDPRKTAEGVAQRLGLSPAQAKKLEDAYAKTLKSGKTVQEQAAALTDDTVAQAGSAAQDKAEQVKNRTAQIRQQLEKKQGATPDEVRRQAANLAANNNPALAERVRHGLKDVNTDNLADLAERAVLQAFSYDASVLKGRPQ